MAERLTHAPLGRTPALIKGFQIEVPKAFAGFLDIRSEDGPHCFRPSGTHEASYPQYFTFSESERFGVGVSFVNQIKIKPGALQFHKSL